MLSLRVMGRLMGRLLLGMALVLGAAVALAWSWDHSDSAARVSAAPADTNAATR